MVGGVDDLDVSQTRQFLESCIVAPAAVVVDDLRWVGLLARQAAATVEVGAETAQAHRRRHHVDGPAVGADREVGVVDDRLEELQVGAFVERQELSPGGDRHPREELVGVVLALLDDRLSFDYLELAQQDQTGDHVRRYHVQVAEEVGEEASDVGEGVAVAVRG